ncbi:hypothetical protein Dimus_011824 [Dionaea muscipula]
MTKIQAVETQIKQVTQAIVASMALEMVRTKLAIITEVCVYEPDGYEFITILEETDDEILVVMVSESDDDEMVKGLVRLGFKFMMKPLREQEIKTI